MSPDADRYPVGKRLAGKRALITGAAGGIGAATAELFCAQGARVVMVDRDAAPLESRAAEITGRFGAQSVAALPADVSDGPQAVQTVASAIQRMGGLDILISNAAIRYLSPVAEADPSKWHDLLSVNLMGAVNFSKAALPALRQSGHASIVIVSSTYALVGRKDFGAYDATKAALVSLTRTLACEEAGANVRVNAVCPGGTLTPFTVGRARARGIEETQLRTEAKTDTLLRRWAEAIEVAWPILWLASDEASFVTGAILPVDGGTSVM